MRPKWPFWKHRAPKMRLAEAQCAHWKHCYPETPLGSHPTSRVSQCRMSRICHIVVECLGFVTLLSEHLSQIFHCFIKLFCVPQVDKNQREKEEIKQDNAGHLREWEDVQKDRRNINEGGASAEPNCPNMFLTSIRKMVKKKHEHATKRPQHIQNLLLLLKLFSLALPENVSSQI